MKIAVIFPTYNAAATLAAFLDSLKRQTIQPDDIIAVDASSTDNTVEILKSYNINYYSIDLDKFNHGSTRKYAASLANKDTDVYIFLTQDIIFVNENSLSNILKVFSDPKIGCAYGRQLPNKNADVLARHLKLFAYPENSVIKTYADREYLGIMTCANSDNFAAYRKEALFAVGGMPEGVFFAEDMYVAAKMLLQEWKVAYCADAMIYHSHNYTFWQEFKHYFDAGAFHAMNPWIFENFSCRVSNSIKYLKSFFGYCIKQSIKHNEYFILPRALGSILAKYFGFLMGKHYKLIPSVLREKISLCDYYWCKL
jgi:rhamnosyltransferase